MNIHPSQGRVSAANQAQTVAVMNSDDMAFFKRNADAPTTEPTTPNAPTNVAPAQKATSEVSYNDYDYFNEYENEELNMQPQAPQQAPTNAPVRTTPTRTAMTK